MDDSRWLTLEWLFLGFDLHRHPRDCLFHQANVEASTNVDRPISPQVLLSHESFSGDRPFYFTKYLNYFWMHQNL
jgi:hypothetical protein